MEKLTFYAPKPKRAERDTQIIRVDKDFYNLIHKIATDTGLSVAKVSEKMAKFLIDKVIIVERD